MHLTVIRMLRKIADPMMKYDRWLKNECLKSQAVIFWQKPRRNRLGMYIPWLRKALLAQHRSRILRFRGRNMLRNDRLDAVCEEHNITRPLLISGLRKSHIQLSKEMLCILAIYEPRTFEGLVEVADRTNIEGLRGRTEILPERRLTSPKETDY